MFKNIISIILLTLTVHISSAQIETPAYKAELNAVESYLREGKFQDAINELERISTKYPTAAEVFYGKALLLNQVGQVDQAIVSAQKAYSLEKSLAYGNYLIELFVRKKEPLEAVNVLKDMRSTYPAIKPISRQLIGMLFDTNQENEALAVYKEEQKLGGASDTLDVVLAEGYINKSKLGEARKLLTPHVNKSKLRQVYASMSFIDFEEKKVKDAIAVLNTGIELSKDPILHLDLADAYRANGNKRLMFESLKVAFASDKVDFGDKYRILTIFRDQNNTDLSSDQLQTLANSLVLVHPRIAESHIIKGELLWRRGSMSEARSLFLTAIGMNNRHIDAWRLLMNVDLSLNLPDDAIKHGLEGLTANPGNPIIMYFTGLSYLVKENHDESRKYLEMALNHSEEENSFLRSLIYSSLGDLYHKLKMYAASDVAYEEAITLDSTNVSAMNNLAYYLSVRKKDLDKAAKYSKLSNEIDPQSATFKDTYAWVLFQQGNYKEALVWIEKAVKESKESSAVLLDHYGDILIQLGKSKEAIKQWEKAKLIVKNDDVDVNKLNQKIKEKRYVE